jgi:hypothetical protein
MFRSPWPGNLPQIRYKAKNSRIAAFTIYRLRERERQKKRNWRGGGGVLQWEVLQQISGLPIGVLVFECRAAGQKSVCNPKVL